MSQPRRSRIATLAVELIVIIVGVLVALAADRWNQTRIDRRTEGAYLGRFVEDIRSDSTRAARYMSDQEGMIAALDTLLVFTSGGPEPVDLGATVLGVSRELVMEPPVTWTEIQASNSLDLVEDLEVRTALTAYYRARERRVLQWSRQDSRARDPFWDALYRIGIFDPRDAVGEPTESDVEAFRRWPRMRELLVGVGSGHYFQRAIAEGIMEEAGQALRVLEAQRR